MKFFGGGYIGLLVDGVSLVSQEALLQLVPTQEALRLKIEGTHL